MSEIESKQICDYFIKFNHNILIKNIYLRKNNVTWPKVYNLKCNICNIEIDLVIGEFEFIKDLIMRAPIISVNEIYFIMKERTDSIYHYSQYTKEENMLTCNEFLIKKILE